MKPNEKRKERKQKLKRLFNYDSEMKFLDMFWQLKSKNLNIDEFTKVSKEILVDTGQVSDVVFDFFIEELYIKENIKTKENQILSLHHNIVLIKNEINILKKSIDDDDDDIINLECLGEDEDDMYSI